LFERRADLPPRLCRAVERAMEKEPAARFATAADMAAALVDAPPDTEATADLSEPLAAPGPRTFRGSDTRRQVIGGVGLVVALAVVLAIVTRGRDRPDPASPAATVATGPAQPLPARAGPIAPGRYRTSALQPPVALTLDNGWALAEPEAADVLFLKRSGQDQPGAELTVLSLKRVFLRDRTYQNAADYVAAGAGEPAPANLVDWLQRHPRLRVSKPSETRIGTVTAVRVDIEAASPYPSEVCVGPCVPLFQLDAEQGRYRLVKLDQGETMRLYIAPVDGKIVVISMVAPTEAMGAVTPAVESVVKTMALG
jgi:hypothetical protein